MITARKLKASILVLGTFLVATVLASPVAAAPGGEPGRPVIVEGILSVLQADDFARGTTRRLYRLDEIEIGRSFEVRFERAPAADLMTGTKVRIHGKASGEVLAVGGESGAVEVIQAAAAVTGGRKALILIVDFADASVACPNSQVSGLMFTDGSSVDGVYRESSFNQLSFPADTNGNGAPDVYRVKITDSRLGCAYGTWATHADAEATKAGVGLSLYQHKMYVIPDDLAGDNTGCGWAGLAYVGCSGTCQSWVATCNLADVYAHELGHNLGMGHSSFDLNNDGAVDSSCSWGGWPGGGEYCDDSDFMGIGGLGWRQNNGPHKDNLGWLGSGKVVQAGSGTWQIAPLESDPLSTNLPQVLKIAKPDTGDYYYLSYRVRTGYDSNLRINYADRTNVHRYTGAGSSNTLYLGVLGDGQTFSDSKNGITFTQTAHGSLSATIQVSLTCTPVAPLFAISPASQSGRAGDLRSYTLSVTNRDSAACPSTTFQLSATVPAGWTKSLAASSLTLAGGQQGSTTLNVTPAPGPDGSYPVGASVGDGSGPLHAATASATYFVDSTAPNAVTDLKASLSKKNQAILTWSVPSDNGGSGVSSFRVYRNNVLRTTVSTTSYTDSGLTAGVTYSYYVVAVDRNGNSSTPGNVVSVLIPKKGR